MNIHISLQSDIPTYEQIKIQIKAQILDGRLAPNQPLTSMRQLARDLRVSVITTTRAYSDLEAEGLIYTVQGRGASSRGTRKWSAASICKTSMKPFGQRWKRESGRPKPCRTTRQTGGDFP